MLQNAFTQKHKNHVQGCRKYGTGPSVTSVKSATKWYFLTHNDSIVSSARYRLFLRTSWYSTICVCLSVCWSNGWDRHPFNGPLSGTTRVSRYQKGKTNLDLLQQRGISSGKSANCLIHITPHQYLTTQFFTGQMPFLPPNQQPILVTRVSPAKMTGLIKMPLDRRLVWVQGTTC